MSQTSRIPGSRSARSSSARTVRGLLGAALAAVLLAGGALTAPAAYAEETGSFSETILEQSTEQGSSAPAETPVAPTGEAPEGEATDRPAGTPESPTAPAAPAEQASNAPDEAPRNEGSPAVQALSEGPAATLDWGVKQSFRSYLVGPIAHGGFELLGTTTRDDTDMRGVNDRFHWTGGAGSALEGGTAAAIGFGDGNGVRFRGHETPVGSGTFILDTSITNPRVVVNSATDADLYVDLYGREFTGITPDQMGDFVDQKGLHLADLTLPAPSVSGATLTWTDAAAVLTAGGAAAFGMYGAGEAIDPVSFSAPVGDGVLPDTQPVQTETVLLASAAKVTEGRSVTLTATVSPANAEGGVEFFDGSTSLGSAPLSAGKAALQTSALPVGAHSITAGFTPTDAAAFTASTSAAIALTVEAEAAAPVEVQVTNASLDWGVRHSFRNYLLGPIAHGGIELLGSTTADANMRAEASRFHWSGGTGEGMTDGSATDISFGGGSGLHLTGHEMTVAGETAHALDLRFTNPRIVITGPGTGTLYFDVKSRKFDGMSSISREFFEQKNVPVATLTLGAPEAAGKTFTWKNVGAILTDQGEPAFGGFYQAGEQLDPLTFSGEFDGELISTVPTTTQLSASSTEVAEGAEISFTATVAPKIDGAVTFSYPGGRIGDPVAVKNGIAMTSTTKLPYGIHVVTASFAPESSEYGISNASVRVVVGSKNPPPPATRPGGGTGSRAAGSLSWGVSSYFASYTTQKSGPSCSTPSRHCAGGSIETSGVGAGWLFPQANGTSWNEATQTGTVRFSGTVAFKGYGTTMFHVSNPSITVTGPTTATLHTGYSGSYGPSSVPLDLGSARKTVGSSGEVTWSNVPVRGGLAGISTGQSANFDALSFTVGATSSVSYGTTAAGAGAEKKAKRTPAATPPATTGIRVLTDPDKIRAGGRIEFEAAGFEPDDEGVLVVLYSDPIVLDEEAGADRNGVVRWSGTLPKDITGKHVITLQGSIDAGAAITILEAKDKVAPGTADVETLSQERAALAVQEVALAGSLPEGGMGLWEWWAAAGGLVAIAACTSVLALRQRRSAVS